MFGRLTLCFVALQSACLHARHEVALDNTLTHERRNVRTISEFIRWPNNLECKHPDGVAGLHHAAKSGGMRRMYVGGRCGLPTDRKRTAACDSRLREQSAGLTVSLTHERPPVSRSIDCTQRQQIIGLCSAFVVRTGMRAMRSIAGGRGEVLLQYALCDGQHARR